MSIKRKIPKSKDVTKDAFVNSANKANAKNVNISKVTPRKALEEYYDYEDGYLVKDFKIENPEPISSIPQFTNNSITTLFSKPKLYFTQKTYNSIKTILSNMDVELQWYCTLKRHKNGLDFVADNIIIPKQIVGPAETTIEENDIIEEVSDSKCSDDDINRLLLVCHTHPDFAVVPSSVDIKSFSEDIQSARKFKQPYYMMAIFNQKGKVFTRLHFIDANITIDNLEIDVYIENDYETAIIDKINKNVKCYKTEDYYDYKYKKNTKVNKTPQYPDMFMDMDDAWDRIEKSTRTDPIIDDFLYMTITEDVEELDEDDFHEKYGFGIKEAKAQVKKFEEWNQI